MVFHFCRGEVFAAVFPALYSVLMIKLVILACSKPAGYMELVIVLLVEVVVVEVVVVTVAVLVVILLATVFNSGGDSIISTGGFSSSISGGHGT